MSEEEDIPGLNEMSADQLRYAVRAQKIRLVEQDKERLENHRLIAELANERRELKALITELADALTVHSTTYPGSPIKELIRHAREATR